MFGINNPFDLAGPAFLQLYLLCLVIVILVAGVWRMIKGITVEPYENLTKPLDPLELAYMRGGKLAVAQTALVELSDQGLIESDKEKKTIRAAKLQPSVGLHPLATALYRAAQGSGGLNPSAMMKETSFECSRIRDRLIDLGLVKSKACRFIEAWPGYLGFSTLIGLGVIKLLVGISRGKPVGYLIGLMIVTVLFGLLLTYTRPLTPKGKELLKRSIDKLKKLRSQSRREQDLFQPQPLATPVAHSGPGGIDLLPTAVWSIALLGLQESSSLFNLDNDLLTMMQKAESSGGTTFSSCGGGGDGGCGGGCGGCGG